MGRRYKDKKTMDHKTLHMKLKIEQHKLYINLGRTHVLGGNGGGGGGGGRQLMFKLVPSVALLRSEFQRSIM